MSADVDLDAVRSVARGALTRHTSLDAVRELRATDLGFDPALWAVFADLGWIGMAFPEEAGGAGVGWRAAGVVFEELGRCLAPSPLLGSSLAGAALAAADPGRAKEVLPDVAEGRRHVALAILDDRHPAGAKFVVDGACADTLLVATDAGRTLALVPRDRPGVVVTPTRTMDGRLSAHITVDDDTIGPDDIVGTEGGVAPAVAAAQLRASAFVAAELLGVADAALDLTVTHLRDRHQFGVPIGSFQALQHRAARMHIAVELTRSLVEDALHGLDSDADDVASRIHAAKSSANETARLVTSEGLQLHGGIGMTDDAAIGLYVKRARVASVLLGDTAYHHTALATIEGF